MNNPSTDRYIYLQYSFNLLPLVLLGSGTHRIDKVLPGLLVLRYVTQPLLVQHLELLLSTVLNNAV